MPGSRKGGKYSSCVYAARPAARYGSACTVGPRNFDLTDFPLSNLSVSLPSEIAHSRPAPRWRVPSRILDRHPDPVTQPSPEGARRSELRAQLESYIYPRLWVSDDSTHTRLWRNASGRWQRGCVS